MTLSASAEYQQVTSRFREWSLLNSCASLLGWDERTYLPPAGVGHRAQQMTLLARMSHEALTSPELGGLIEKLETAASNKPPDLDSAATIREIRRLQHRAVKLPSRLVEELAGCVIHSQQACNTPARTTILPCSPGSPDCRSQREEGRQSFVIRLMTPCRRVRAGATAREIT